MLMERRVLAESAGTSGQPGNWKEPAAKAKPFEKQKNCLFIGFRCRGLASSLGTSRMTGDCHVRFCKGVAGKPAALLGALSENQMGNLTRHTTPDGGITRYIHDKRGLPLRITDAKGGVKWLAWNERAQLTQYTDCSGQTTGYAYDGWGNLKSITDALGQTTTQGQKGSASDYFSIVLGK
jgi:YD repeat-containing protein